VLNPIMDIDVSVLIVLGLFATAAAMRGATRGHPLPSYMLALVAGGIAIYATEQDDLRSHIFMAWSICATAILSAYAGTQVQRIKNS
jgi:hypothetical protein